MSDLYNEVRTITTSISYPDISEIFISDNYCELSLDNLFKSDDLFLEPRSINSSEFSESEGEGKKENKQKDKGAKCRSQSTKKRVEKKEVEPENIQNLSVGSLSGTNYHGRCKFTPEQDELILTMYKKYGGSWKKIAGIIGDGLTPSMIKNRFYKNIKKRAFPQLAEKKTPEVSKEVKAENDKKNHLSNLYEKAKSIEEFIKKAKSQIEVIESRRKQDSVE